MKEILYFFVLILNVEHLWAFYENQPKILTRDGNLILEAAEGKNVTIRTRSFMINDVDLLYTLQGVRNSSNRGDGVNYRELIEDVSQLRGLIYNRGGVISRLQRLENNTSGGRPWGPPGGPPRNNELNRIRRRIRTLETKVNRMLTKLRTNNCRTNPCQNGGTCVNLYDSYICHCPKNWQGPTCGTDVNECAEFAGTDLGCQNGATCTNTQGGYSCTCAPGFVGTHCLKRSVDCLTSGTEMCGHGICVHSNDQYGYKCICEQGWKTNGLTPPCTVDVDECIEGKPHCSKDPEVACINLPGSVMCGACPVGFTGNGYYCADIDECAVNNGGCSTAPFVRCTNLRGSFRCGRCPRGFVGDGKTCTPSSSPSNSLCATNICHPLATCSEFPISVVNCVCPPGYTGAGFGPYGCSPSNDTSRCPPGFCQNGGTCYVNGTSYACHCPPGTIPPVCVRPVDTCQPNPCTNGGTCVPRGGTYYCSCRRGFTGINCQTPARRCGGVLRQENGTLKYPEGNEPYQHNTRCAWLIQTNASMVLNVTFKSFDFERPLRGDCRFDWLQIHDGRSSSSYMIGRFCGNKLPKGGNIISTQNALYLWFRSDNSTAHDGFELTWETVPPVCGGEIMAESHGIINSPGSPGNYPMNRDCYWTIYAPPGKRIQLNFHTLQIEAHVDCAYDYLAIYDGINVESPLIEKFCNTSTPEPLLTPGSDLLLHFHSDDDNSDVGFQISYSVQPGVPGCGGLFTGTDGVLASPVTYEDRKYPNNLECEYLIRQPKNMKIFLTVLEFHLEDSSDCKFDYLEIYDGKTTNDPLIGRFCSTFIPTTFRSQTNEILLKFKSDWSTSHSGFNIKYKAICGGTYSEPNGVFTSPYYPNEYPGSAECVFEIAAPLGNAIELDFEDFDIESNTECAYDFVEIFDGHSSNDTSLGKFCGSTKPGRVVSTYNYLTLGFNTDRTVHGRGFKANYTFIELNCGGIVKTNGSIVSPPMEGSEYAHGAFCRWLIVAPEGFNINLNWVTFNLEVHETCDYDYVEVFDNSTQKDIALGRFCDTIPPMISTVGNIATVVFKSDTTTSAGGFTLKVEFQDARENCGGRFFSKSGYIRSPGWPQSYPHSRTCEWFLQVPPHHQIQLTFSNFSVEDSTDCKFDRLVIRNGATSSSPVLGTFCGENKILPMLKSFGNQLYLQFIADASKTEAGFEIEWTSTLTGCGGTLTSYKGSITSPQYPETYTANALCSWRIVVGHGSTIRFVFTDFELEADPNCAYDYLQIYDGKDASARSLGKYCETNQHPLDLQTSSNYAFIRFASDRSNQYRGFNLNYLANCNTTLTGWNGIIESPNFPEEYPHRIDCEWTIQTYKGNKVYIEFTDLDLEQSYGWSNSGDNAPVCSFDYIEITQYKKNDTVKTDRYCNQKPVAFTSVDNQVMITFHTDISGSGKGFRLEWNSEGCGGILRKPQGNFSTPNYPNGYPHDLECVWDIETDFGKTIELTIEDLDIEHSNDCRYDGVRITTGGDLELPLAKMCHLDQNGRKIIGHGHQMRIHFFSDSTMSYRGFSASYKTLNTPCGGALTAPLGEIYSPNYPKNYGPNETCEWQITVDPSHNIDLTLIDFDLEPSEDCSKDVMYIFDGEVEDAEKILLKSCGNSMPNQTIYTTTSNKALVVLKTDSTEEYKGFRLNYTTSCGSHIRTNDSGLIHLSDITRLGNFDCTWIIEADDLSKHVTLTITHIESIFGRPEDGDCFYFLKVFDGTSVNGPERTKLCQMSTPPTIVSNGNAFTVHLGINRTFSESLVGLDIVAHYSVLDNACGGTLTSFSGQFASPSWPLSYPLNIECIWAIQASPGNALSLTIRELDIAPSDNCNSDYLEIREMNADGKLLGVYCGSNTLTNHTNSNQYWIKFKSGSDGTAKGFLAEYSYVRDNEISGPEGTITSPLYPRQFMGEEVITYRVTVDVGSVVVIKFDQLRFRPKLHDICMASIQIYDGYDETAVPLSERLCGFEIPDPLTSTTNVVYLIVKQTNYESNRGSSFKLTYRAINPTKNTTEPLIDGCGGDITISNRSQFINLTSPGFPYGYDTQLNCTWNIYSGNPTFHPAFYFTDVDLEDQPQCYGDYIRIGTSKDGVTWKDRDRVCNSNIKPGTLFRAVEGEPYLRINFRSDYATNRTGFSGFAFIKCGGELTGPSGEITAMNEDFPTNTLCMYNITVRPGKTIEFEFEEFNLPKLQDHCGSYITFKNGQDDTAPLLGQGKYCGVNIPEIPRTSSRYAFVKFYANRLNIFFKLKYREVGIDCGGTVMLTQQDNSSKIMSPNFPNMPHPHSECVWNVIAPSGEAITLTFVNRFDLTRTQDCNLEYVELREGGTERSLMINRYCGFIMPQPITTKSNRLRLKFFTDVNEPKNGFQAEVRIATCGGTYSSPTGIISSEGFGNPGAYPANSECIYRILGRSGTTIELQVKQLHLPDGDNENCTEVDHVSIYAVLPSDNDAANQNQEELMGEYCGQSIPPPIKITSNEILIKFKTFVGNTIYKGFQMKYNISYDQCLHEIVAESGVITSPGYPNRIGLNRYCEWRITVPKGRRVSAKIVDLDFSTAASKYNQRLLFYSGFTTRIRIKTITGVDTLQTVNSSDNTMLITAWVRTPTSNRGFKIEFSSDEPTLCEGSLNEAEGIIYSPIFTGNNISAYLCDYERNRPIATPTTGTLILELKDVKAGLRSMPDCRFLTSKLLVQWKGAYIESESYFAKLCGIEIPDTTVYTPFYDTVVSARQSMYGGVTNFTLLYRTMNCGGVFTGSVMIRNSSFTPIPTKSVGCAWYISQRTGVTMHIRVNKLKMTDTCDKEYIQIFNGKNPLSPHLVRYCGNTVPSETLNTQSEYLYMYYYSENFNAGSEFYIDVIPTAAACGGVIHTPIHTIQSPGNGTYYNNMECVWEIRAEPGYMIDLWFKDRFYLEDTIDCVKDYVEVSKLVGTDTWISYGKFCGRHLPPVFNTTSSRMKVKIHTDATNVGDGFTFEWAQKCGGIFTVTDEVQTMISPQYPQNYDPNLKCNYTFIAVSTSAYVNLVFKDFQLEETSRACMYDNVTIYKYNEFQYREQVYDKVGTYCRQDSPGHVRIKGKAVVFFQSDSYHEKGGFLFEYHLDKCGYDINDTTEIESPSQSENSELPSGLNCIWKITAPVGRNIIIRFERINLENSGSCWFDYVAVYRSHNMSDSNRAAKLCGSLTDNAIDLVSDKGIIQLKTDQSINKGFFRARVIMSVDCSKQIEILQSNPVYNLEITQQNYAPLMDCHYLVKTDMGSIIQAKFNRFHVSQCNHNATDMCSCNFVEVRDGAGPYAEVIGKFCGHELPRTFQSSMHFLWIRFATGSLNDTISTFDLQLKRIPSVCGTSMVNITKNETFVLEPPRVNGKYQKDLQCTWTIETPIGNHLEVTIEQIDIEDPDPNGVCANDYLKITDEQVKDYLHDKTFEDNIVFTGQNTQSRDVSFYMGMYRPQAPHIFCGHYDSNHRISYYTHHNIVHVKFASNNEVERTGFRLNFRPAGNCHDYEGMQGRMTVNQVMNCTFYIRAPQNHTVAVYFNSLYFYNDNCTKAGLKIFDGESPSEPSIIACSYTTPNPFFSESNVVKVVTNAFQDYSGNYDISYVATDKGRGCGGTLINYGGVFSSPLYPENIRNETDCRWTIHVPKNMKVALRFTIFDFGSKSTCNGNYIQIIEKNNAGEEEVKRQYCGEDEITTYRSEKSIVAVRMKTTRNFAGTGFLANFIAVFEDTIVQNW